MQHINIITRRSFLSQSFKTGLAVAMSTLVDIPFVLKRALAEGTIGLNGKKLLFIWMRGANDGLNSVIPISDDGYYNYGTVANPIVTRPTINILKDTAANYGASGPCFDATQFADVGGTARTAAQACFSYTNGIALGNGYAALHPSLKFLAPLYNQGDLALIHRVGYPRQSRSHFDSQNYWENGNPNNNVSKDGIFYRTMLESGFANTHPLTGVSIQSSLPLILRGPKAAMTNLSDVKRYQLLGIPDAAAGKAVNSLAAADGFPAADKNNRELLSLHYQNLLNTLPQFSTIVDLLDDVFLDDVNTDQDFKYNLFPSSNATNGGFTRPGGGTDANKYVVDTGAYAFFNNLKAAALVLNHTDAIIAGTEVNGSFDTHSNQGGVTGSQPNLLRRIGWAMYALQKYFKNNSNKAAWDNLVVVTLSEFGRTTVENSDRGTDHAEASVMFVAGGAVHGRNKGNSTGVYGCSTADAVPWVPGPPNQGGNIDGSMFGIQDRYLKRAYDYRSILGKVIRDHLGATQAQLNRIIPGYTVAGEHLQAGGTSSIDSTPIMAEPPIV
jgi:uncharacterized protein (DUF1501 family)